ncbi:MAG: hypothetical protein V3U54_07710 [Thermodesulfobacteriota bacterium]
MKKLRFFIFGAVLSTILSNDFNIMLLDPTWWIVVAFGFVVYALIEYTLITPAIKDFIAFMKKRQRGKK